MTSNVANPSADSTMHWARELHPSAWDPTSALAAPSPQGGGQAPQAAADGEHDHPLRGVRFAALKAPGPSGLRPEHIAELLGVRRRRLANKLLRALGRLLDAIAGGRLCEEARWITRSRSIFIEKRRHLARPSRQGRTGTRRAP